jgi:hypothetical protein
VAYIEFFAAPNMSCRELKESGQDEGFIQYLRFIRVIRLLRAFKVLKIFAVLRTMLHFRPTTISLLKCTFFVCMLTHVSGCTWWLMKTSVHTAEELAAFKEENSIEIPIVSSYIVAVYFLMCTLCTVGYGDISAETDEERVLMTVVMLIGSAVFAIIISNMGQIVGSLQAETCAREETIQDVLQFLHRNQCGHALQFRVQGYFEFRLGQSKFHSRIEDIVEDIPRGLADEINLSILWPILEKSSVFDGIPRQSIRDLAYHLQPCTKLPGELVFKHGHEPTSLFIQLSGQVQLHLPSPGIFIDGHLLWNYSKGDIVGSPDLILGFTRCGDAWATGYANHGHCAPTYTPTLSPPTHTLSRTHTALKHARVQDVRKRTTFDTNRYVEVYELAASVARDLIHKYPVFRARLTSEMARRAKDIRGIMQLNGRSWEVVDRSLPVPRWLYMACRLSCKARSCLSCGGAQTQKQNVEAAAKKIDAKSGWSMGMPRFQALMPSFEAGYCARRLLHPLLRLQRSICPCM